MKNAQNLEAMADRTADLHFASSLRQRARNLREIGREIDLLEHDPLYRTIHDRPAALAPDPPL